MLPAAFAPVMTVMMIEIEEIEQVADGRAVHRHVRIAGLGDRVREVVAAAIGDRRQVPVPLDEFDDRDVIGIVVGNVAGLRQRRNHDQRDAGAVAEVIERLHVA